jgi:hypothetical protein
MGLFFALHIMMRARCSMITEISVLLSDAPPEHIEAVGKYLPIDLTRVLPRGMLRAA